MREWRLKSNLLDLTQENCFIITKTKEEYESIAFSDDCIGDIDFNGCVADGQFWGTATGYFERGFKGISIEDIAEFNRLSKNEVDKIIDKQDFNDTVGRNLGGFIW